MGKITMRFHDGNAGTAYGNQNRSTKRARNVRNYWMYSPEPISQLLQ